MNGFKTRTKLRLLNFFLDVNGRPWLPARPAHTSATYNKCSPIEPAAAARMEEEEEEEEAGHSIHTHILVALTRRLDTEVVNARRVKTRVSNSR